jgi:hypothetical protein
MGILSYLMPTDKYLSLPTMESQNGQNRIQKPEDKIDKVSNQD